MDKRDWKEAKRREKAAAAAAEKSQAFGESGSGSGSSFPQSTSSPSGADAQASTGDMEVNAYPPEMDEMRCLLWAHGGQDPSVSGSLGCLQLYSFSHRGLLFWERGPGKVRGHCHAFVCSWARLPGVKNAGI